MGYFPALLTYAIFGSLYTENFSVLKNIFVGIDKSFTLRLDLFRRRVAELGVREFFYYSVRNIV